METVVDYSDAVNLALASHQPLDTVLRDIHFHGITSLALTEDTVDSLRTDGALSIQHESNTETIFSFAPDQPTLETRFEDALQHKTAINCTKVGNTLVVNAPYIEINLLGLGLDPEQVSTTIRNGLYICPRIANFPGADADSIMWTLQSVKAQCGNKATTLIFSGLDVLGDRNSLHDTATALAATGLHYGSVEFGKQIGDDILTRLAASETVRVHSIGGNEMPTMDIPTAIGRFGLAARERSIRVCYIRFFIGGAAGEKDILKTNDDFVYSIKTTLKDGHLELGAAHPYTKDPLPGKALLILMGFGAIAAGLLLFRLFTGVQGPVFWILLAVGLAAAAYLATRSTTPIGRELLALLAALSLPTIGLLLNRVPRSVKPQTPVVALTSALIQYAALSATTFLGILLVVGLLADRLFMLKVYEFAGIKVAVFAPILLVAIFYAAGFDSLVESATWQQRWNLITAKWNGIMIRSLTIGEVIIGVVGLAVVAILLLRSGNDPGIGVSSTELGFRKFLGQLLSVRPRTKEFLFGHPLVIIGLALAYSRRRRFLILALLAGAIGQSSLLNTFCHIHTPLSISILRALIGLVLGALIGSVVYLLLQKFVSPDRAEKPIIE